MGAGPVPRGGGAGRSRAPASSGPGGGPSRAGGLVGMSLEE